MEKERYITIFQFMLYLALAGGLYLILQLNLKASLSISILVSLLPLGFFFLLILLKNPFFSFLLLFSANYLVMGAMRYVPGLKGGIIIDALLLLIFGGIFMNSFHQKWPWRHLKNGLITITSIWLVFCLLNILNPDAPFNAWLIGIRRTAVYFIIGYSGAS